MSVIARGSPFGGPIKPPDRHRDQQLAFRTLFPPLAYDEATPQTSPLIGVIASPVDRTSQPVDTLSDTLQRQKTAWSLVTAWLSLSGKGEVPREHLEGALEVSFGQSASLYHSLSLESWYSRQVEQHFERSIELKIKQIWSESSSADDALSQTVALLKDAQGSIVRPVVTWQAEDTQRRAPNPVLSRHVERLHNTALSALHRAVRRTVPAHRYAGNLAFVLVRVLETMTARNADTASNRTTMELLAGLHEVGLTPDSAQKSLARAVQTIITSHVNSFDMKVDWVGQRGRASELRIWIEQSLQPSVRHCLCALTGDRDLEIPASDLDKWQRLALGVLGRARLANLLVYVQLWPQSLGAILDLKDYLALADAKQHLAQTFINQLEERVGHAGVTTAELLGIYVAVTRVFKTLDNRSVLLEKVAQPIRSFLRDRLDTVKVIAASFLAEIDDEAKDQSAGVDGDDYCLEITREVIRSERTPAQPNQSLDWNDMTWLPDPIDAGPDYRSTKSNDVISYMLTLFDKETFIQEIQNILGERLLRSESANLENEVRLVEMLKSRLGTDKLQSAEVMVRDMTDSARIMKLLRSVNSKIPQPEDIYKAIPDDGITFAELVASMRLTIPSNPELKNRFIAVFKEAAIGGPAGKGHLLFRKPDYISDLPPPQDMDTFDAKILSSFFWPELRDDSFKVPAAIQKAQEQYESGFRRIKVLRRLRWLSALGRADVELELKDRTVKVEAVKTWVAALIYAFQDTDVSHGDMDVDEKTVQRSVADLEEQLNMDEVLVRNAIAFWVGQRVLHEVSPDTFEVMETLPKEGDVAAPLAVPVQADEAVSALKSQSAVLKDNKMMYEMFMIGMLTNGGAMDTSRIAMML